MRKQIYLFLLLSLKCCNFLYLRTNFYFWLVWENCWRNCESCRFGTSWWWLRSVALQL